MPLYAPGRELLKSSSEYVCYQTNRISAQFHALRGNLFLLVEWPRGLAGRLTKAAALTTETNLLPNEATVLHDSFRREV